MALSEEVVLLGIDDPAGHLDPARIVASGEGGPVRPPFSWARVQTGGGGAVLLLIAPAQPSLAAGATLRLAREDGQPLAAAGPVTTRNGFPALLGTAEPAALSAALRFVASKALGTLRRAEDAGLAANCHRAAAAALPDPGRVARPVARVGEGLVLWDLPAADTPRGRGGAHTLLGPARLRRVPAVGRAVLLPARQAATGAVLLPADGGGPVRLLPPPPASTLPSLTEFGRRPDPAARALHRDALATLAAGDAPARRLLRDLRLVGGAGPAQACVAPEHPFGGALDMAIPDGAGGVFLRGWLRDPLGLVAGLALRGPDGEKPLPFAELHRFARPDLAETYAEAPHGAAGAKPGFAVHLPDAGGGGGAGWLGGQWGLRLALTTGDTAQLVAPPGPAQPRAARDAVLGAIAPRHLTPDLLQRCIAPAVERLQRAAMALRGTPEAVRIGGGAPARQRRRPAATLVVPLYRNLRFLRHQYAAFARDPLLRETAELVYVLDSPDQREDVEHLLRGLHGVCRMPVTLVVQAENYGYASACNAGAAVAEAPVLALVNSDVVPAARGWLEPLLRELDRLSAGGRPAAVGPKLLFDDGSLQHAGLFFEAGAGGEWYNNHYWKGFPRFHPPALTVRPVPGVTGALLCLRRHVFEALGGLCTDYVVGDYEDSDLCLRLRAAGGEIAYVPEAELFHFERQSIRDHGGYARTSACNYNRHLHHARWAPAIEALMARFPGAPIERAA
jgi:GT2 family glycosyltransferase